VFKYSITLWVRMDVVRTQDTTLFNQFGLTIKYDKSEVFYFFRLKNIINSFLLELRPASGAIIRSKDTW